MSSPKAKFPSKVHQVICWYCDKTILKQNFKAHNETVHTGKQPRDKLKGAAFDLFQFVNKRTVEESTNSSNKKASEKYI